MSAKRSKTLSRALVASAVVFLASQACYAGGAAILVPVEDRDVPAGTLIPDHRIEKIESLVQGFKDRMRANAAAAGQQQPATPAEPTLSH